MSTFTVEPENSESEVLGADVADLQSNIAVTSDLVTGTLHYYTGYTGFSGDPDLQEGNFLAMKVDNVPEGATMTVELEHGYSGPVELDSDLNFVLRIADKDNQIVKVTASKDSDHFSKEFLLTHLTCESEA